MKFVRPDSVEDFEYFGTAGFSPATKKISLNWKVDLADKRGAASGYFHEHGHYIDFMAAGRKNGNFYSTSNQTFSDALKRDFEACVQRVMSENNCERLRASGILEKEEKDR